MNQQSLLSESNAQKSQANQLFSASQYSQAIGEYDKALSSCPNYLDYEIAVLKSNIAACHLKLEDWKSAVDSATAAIESLERLSPKKKPEQKGDGERSGGDDAVVEIEGDGEDAEKELASLKLSDQRKDDIVRIRSKALMRRAKAKFELGGWGNLQGAEEGRIHSSRRTGLHIFHLSLTDRAGLQITESYRKCPTSQRQTKELCKRHSPRFRR